MRIALLPLDERPVNTALPVEVGAIGGAQVLLPPRELLPDQRQPGRAEDLVAWLAQVAGHPSVGSAVVCLDTALYGGLIAGRTSTDSLRDCLARLEAVAHIRARRPDLPLDAVSLVMRASNSNDAGEEPEYWAHFGKALHRLGAALHRELRGEDGGAEVAELIESIPIDVRLDFERRRLRNHHVNLEAIDLLASGAVASLLLTADDTAPRSAGSAEQEWLAHWARALPHTENLLMYPGADEVGAVLVARAMVREAGVSPSFRIECAEPGGLERIAPYENRPVGEATGNHVRAAGGILTSHSADTVLVIHAPDPGRHDWAGAPPDLTEPDHRAAAEVSAKLVADLLGAGQRVALADVRYGNGGDPLLVDALADAGWLGQLAAYGGWNTAGNATGSVVAAAAARVAGQASGAFDEVAARRVLLQRVLEDRFYQAGIRPEVEAERGQGGGAIIEDAALRDSLSKRIGFRLQQAADALAPGEGWRVTGTQLPWRRTFEVGFELTQSSR